MSYTFGNKGYGPYRDRPQVLLVLDILAHELEAEGVFVDGWPAGQSASDAWRYARSDLGRGGVHDYGVLALYTFSGHTPSLFIGDILDAPSCVKICLGSLILALGQGYDAVDAWITKHKS